MKIIPYGRQFIGNDDLKAVTRALKRDLITTGIEVKNFESMFSKKTGVKYSVSCSNATSGLLLAYLAVGIKKNNVIIMPSINFVASINMAYFIGAKVFLTDVDPLTGIMRAEDLEACIKKYNLKKIHTVVTMHNGGIPSNMKNFLYLKKKYRFNIIEDACHALGGSYLSKKEKVGNCKYSEITVFSFHPVKNITTGEGGMITTNNKKIYEKLIIYRNHGMIRKKSNKNKYVWNYKIITPGFNFRLNDIQSALGISQMKKLNLFINKRKAIVKRYKKNLSSMNKVLSFFDDGQNTIPAYHLFIINLNLKQIHITRDQIIKKLFKSGILTQVHYIPIFLFPYYKKFYKSKNFKNAMRYYNSSLSIPIYYSLTFKEVDYISEKIKEIVK